MSLAICTGNLPTLVPPNFWINHFASGSMVFWCKFGGVTGRECSQDDGVLDEADPGEDRGCTDESDRDREDMIQRAQR